jgi:hypothetical protein
LPLLAPERSNAIPISRSKAPNWVDSKVFELVICGIYLLSLANDPAVPDVTHQNTTIPLVPIFSVKNIASAARIKILL